MQRDILAELVGVDFFDSGVPHKVRIELWSDTPMSFLKGGIA